MGKIVSLALVVRAGKLDSRTIYAGWTDAGLPVVSLDTEDLTPESLEEAETFIRSGYPIPSITLRRQLSVVVVEFAGPVKDMEDPSPRSLVQDSIQVTVTDTRGRSIDLTLGELEVLEMIGNNMITFQKFGSVLDTQDRQVAVSYYSFFLPGNSQEDREDLIVLMKPTNRNVGNIIDAVLFIQDVIKKLLQNDQKQPPEYRKRYLDAGREAEVEIAQALRKQGGLFSFLMADDPTVPKPPGLADTLGEMLKDMLSVTPDGKGKNPFLKSNRSGSDPLPDRKILDRIRLTAVKMYGYAKSRIRR